MSEPIKIILADDHKMLREGFKTMLRKQTELSLVAEAENGAILLEKVNNTPVDVIITDIKMPAMDGIEACKKLQVTHPHVGVIALSTFDDEQLILDMIKAGAKGYLLKNTDKEELIKAVKSVYHGGIYYCNAVSDTFQNRVFQADAPRKAKDPVDFTERELDIIKLAAQQFTSKEIASMLKLSARTVQSHKDRMQERIDAKNMIGVVMYALRHNLISVHDSDPTNFGKKD